MGRYVTCGDDLIWSYVLGRQPSELNRIALDFDVGRLQRYAWSDEDHRYVPVGAQDAGDVDELLVLRSDIHRLRSIASDLEASDTDAFFRGLVEAIVEYAEERCDVAEFLLRGTI